MPEDLNSVYNRIKEKQRRRRDTVIIILTAGILVFLTYFMRKLTSFSSAIPLSNNIALFGLINLNIILLTLLLFFLIRNITKVVMGRRQRITASTLRTKLILTMIGFSILPALIFFAVATNFITKSIDNWFGVQIESSLQRAKDIVDTYYKNMGDLSLSFARNMRDEIIVQGMLDNPAVLKRYIKRRIKENNLSVVEIFDTKGKVFATIVNENAEFGSLVSENADILINAYQGKEDISVASLESGDIVWAVLPVFDSNKKINGVIAVNYFLPRSLVDKMASVVRDYDNFKSTEIMKTTIKGTYIVFLLVITLLVIFSASWLGVQIANSITVPIREVAVAASRIARGELNVHITPPQEEEIRNLVDSFNKMTKDLKLNQTQLGSAYQKLEQSNLELEQRKKYMEAVLKNVASGVVSLDAEGIITMVNSRAENILRLNAIDVIGKKYKNVFGSNHMTIVKTMMDKVERLNRDSVQGEMEFDNGESIVSLLLNLTILRDDNKYMGVVVVFEDITELLKVQKLAAWKDVAKRVTHEIKNPLTPIQLSAQRLKRKYSKYITEDFQIFEDCIHTIIRQTETLKTLVNEFSNFERLPILKPTLGNLNETVNNVIALYKTAHKNINFTVFPDSSLPFFEFDKDQINRLLINLLDNAVNAVNEKGEIMVRTLFNGKEDCAVLEVADTGCGVSKDIKPHLFEPYFSSRKGGMGLGLAIVHSIVREHNGRIRIEDNSPVGAKFIVELPRHREGKNVVLFERNVV
ncbi:MAG TPA: ATP-binding protein [bacterium]